jgi:Flp pilus assembly secretin CpaC
MTAPYYEVAGTVPNGCPVSGTVIYSLDVAYPSMFAFSSTSGSGYMATIITPGTADGTSYHAALFRAGGCAVLAGPSIVNVSGGTLSFAGAGSVIISAAENDIVEFWH